MNPSPLPAPALLLCMILAAAAHGQALHPIDSDPVTGVSAAVLVDDVPLIYTAQLLPIDEAGNLIAPGDAAGQFQHLLDRLGSLLRTANADLGQIAKLNLYVSSDEAGQAVRSAIARRLATGNRPAVSFVTTPLSQPGALVALDAVAAAGAEAPRGVSGARLLPPGTRIYVSGQADRSGDLEEATRKTLESLSATLKHCGRTDGDVVQLKCFFQPMQSIAVVREAIVRYYGSENLPALSFVEWRSASPLIEIELVTWGGPANPQAAEPLEFITPPGLTPSPLFSRVAVIHRGGTMFIGDLFGPANASAEDQTQEAFERLRELLTKAGTDFKHLAKATYYVTDDEVSRAHNAIRPKYYDPARPPAASKALVHGTGRTAVRYVMDMLAVP